MEKQGLWLIRNAPIDAGRRMSLHRKLLQPIVASNPAPQGPQGQSWARTHGAPLSSHSTGRTHSPIRQFDVQKSFTLSVLSNLNGALHPVVLVNSDMLICVQHCLQSQNTEQLRNWTRNRSHLNPLKQARLTTALATPPAANGFARPQGQLIGPTSHCSLPW